MTEQLNGKAPHHVTPDPTARSPMWVPPRDTDADDLHARGAAIKTAVDALVAEALRVRNQHDVALARMGEALTDLGDQCARADERAGGAADTEAMERLWAADQVLLSHLVAAAKPLLALIGPTNAPALAEALEAVRLHREARRPKR